MADLIKHYERNTRGRDLVIGDIHGLPSVKGSYAPDAYIVVGLPTRVSHSWPLAMSRSFQRAAEVRPAGAVLLAKVWLEGPLTIEVVFQLVLAALIATRRVGTLPMRPSAFLGARSRH